MYLNIIYFIKFWKKRDISIIDWYKLSKYFSAKGTYSEICTIKVSTIKMKATKENLVCACKNCNQKKGNRTPQEANMSLVKKPKRPNRIHYFQRYVKDRQADWRPYLFMERLSLNNLT